MTYVTSDCHQVWTYGNLFGLSWEERLVAGVGFNAPQWEGPERGIQFLSEAFLTAGVYGLQQFAGYDLEGELRTRNVKASTFMAAVQGGRWKPKPEAVGVLLTGYLEERTEHKSSILIGGHAGVVPGAPPSMMGTFIFPFDDKAGKVGRRLLELAVEYLGAAYGYYFVRDNAFLPRGYAIGIPGGEADIFSKYKVETEDISLWLRTIESQNWKSEILKLRDVYEVNLVSRAYLNNIIDGIPLSEWILSDASRGELRLISSGKWIWNVDAKNLKAVRAAVAASGALVSRHVPLYRD